MSTSTAALRASTSVSTTPQFWERLWRTAGVQSVGLFVVAYFVYGNQPHVRRIDRCARRVLPRRSNADPDRYGP